VNITVIVWVLPVEPLADSSDGGQDTVGVSSWWEIGDVDPDWDCSRSTQFGEVAVEMREFVAQMTAPYCGNHAVYESQAWFGEAAPHLKSFALVPLRRAGHELGVLALASEDAQRFYPEMGTLYLTRIGDLLACALGRTLTPLREPAG